MSCLFIQATLCLVLYTEVNVPLKKTCTVDKCLQGHIMKAIRDFITETLTALESGNISWSVV